MGNIARVTELRAQRRSAGGDISGRHVRTPWSLPLFATFVTFAFVVVTLAPPVTESAYAVVAPGETGDAQTLTVAGEYTQSTGRDKFTITDPVVVELAASAATPDAGSAQAIAYTLVKKKGWNDKQFDCLVSLWNKESHWNASAENPSSGAYGIPQAVPGNKMASVASDWKTNPKTQIIWGLGYIEGRYGNPCGAWETSESQGWY